MLTSSPAFMAILTSWIMMVYADLYLTELRRETLKTKSLRRYQLTTIQIVVVSIELLLASAVVVFAVRYHAILPALTYTYLVYQGITRLKKLFDDNNWFNDQFDNFKQGFKNLRARLAFPLSLPSPT